MSILINHINKALIKKPIVLKVERSLRMDKIFLLQLKKMRVV